MSLKHSAHFLTNVYDPDLLEKRCEESGLVYADDDVPDGSNPGLTTLMSWKKCYYQDGLRLSENYCKLNAERLVHLIF